MIFNKKKSFLYISILVLLLVGVYFVNSSGYIDRTPTLSTGFVTTNTSVVTINGNQTSNGNGLSFQYTELANWTRGGGMELFNFTLTTLSSVTNISTINITLPSSFSNITAAYTNNASNASWTLDIWNNRGSSTILAFFNVTNISSGGYFTGAQTISLWFNVIAVNGTETVSSSTNNWTITATNSSNIDSGLGVITGVDGLPPRAGTHNATDSVNTRSSFTSTQYLRYDTSNPQQGINITLTVTDYNADRVLLIYNSTGGSLNLTAIRRQIYNNVSEIKAGVGSDSNDGTGPGFNGEILERAGLFGFGNASGLLSLSTRSNLLTSAPSYVFSFNLSNNTWGRGASDATTFKYVFVVYDLYNHSEIINNSNSEFIIARDKQNPTATLTAPSDTSISLYGTLKYTCSGSDTSSIASCTMTITKPGSSGTVTKTGCSEQTIGDPTSETNTAGDYTVACSVTDGVGRTGSSSSSTFSVSATTSGGSGSSGGGGGGSGGGSSAGSSSDNPVTVQAGITSELGTLSTSDTFTSVSASGGLSFTVNNEAHTAKVLTVTGTSATIEFTSTPQTLTLNVGETKEVDLNDNGEVDLSVMLKSITNGKADLVFKAVQEVEQPPAPVTPPTTETKSNMTWLWILIVLVVIGLVWYFTRKKQ